jgi:hypothetical protein
MKELKNPMIVGRHIPKKDKSGYYMLISLELYERLVAKARKRSKQ